MSERPRFNEDNIKPLYDARFLRLYDLQYKEGAHYYDVSRRTSENLVARKTDNEFREMLPDAVTIAVVVEAAGEEPRLLLNYEYRYPVGQYLLSPIAGLIDPDDCGKADPLITAAKREIYEESGLRVKDSDRIEVINPCAFSSPGMTDESNAFLYANIKVDDLTGLSQDGAEGSEMFRGYELIDKAEAQKLFTGGRDKYGNFFSIATWIVLAIFLNK
jgi:ADP-ribose pyrophosphatase